MLLFHLSGENLELAREEIVSLGNIKKYQQIKNVLMADIRYNNIFDNLAYTHGIFKILFACDAEHLIDEISLFNFNRHFKEDFGVRILNFSENKLVFNEEDLGSLVYGKIRNPKVNLTNPKTQFFFIFADHKAVCCELIKSIDKKYNERKPHLKPELHPTSLSPKLAKALINLSGIRKGMLLDPFCGSGGIMVEAGLIGLNPVGFDIDRYILGKAKKNLEHYAIMNFTLEYRDSTKLTGKYDYVVSELPFGKNSKISDKIGNLYSNFLKSLDNILVKKAVLVFPDFIDYTSMIKKTNLKLKNEFEHYVHKSKTRKIVVLSH
jgi:tRNA (guanine10-N2)-dimethyltransferase